MVLKGLKGSVEDTQQNYVHEMAQDAPFTEILRSVMVRGAPYNSKVNGGSPLSQREMLLQN